MASSSRSSSCATTPGSWPFSSIPNFNRSRPGPTRSSAISWPRRCSGGRRAVREPSRRRPWPPRARARAVGPPRPGEQAMVIVARDFKTRAGSRSRSGRDHRGGPPGRWPAERSPNDDWVGPAFWDIQLNGRWGYSFSSPDLTVEQCGDRPRPGDTRHSAALPTLITAPPGQMLHACGPSRRPAKRIRRRPGRSWDPPGGAVPVGPRGLSGRPSGRCPSRSRH